MNAFKIIMRDRPHTMPVEQMRALFEQGVAETPALHWRVNLVVVEEDNVFTHYLDPNTDALWLGFAIGLRCSERIARATEDGDEGRDVPAPQ